LNYSKTKWGLLICISALLCLLFAIPAIAGDGSGGGKDNPLVLVSSVPEDNQRDVSLSTRIQLSFSKNVVNMAVKDNNQSCFSLYDGKDLVPIDVILADDQIEPERKKEI